MFYHLSVRDRVEWDSDQERQAEEAVKLNSPVLLPDDKIGTGTIVLLRLLSYQCCLVEYEEKADHFWDSFYMQHQNRFVCFVIFCFKELIQLSYLRFRYVSGLRVYVFKCKSPSADKNL